MWRAIITKKKKRIQTLKWVDILVQDKLSSFCFFTDIDGYNKGFNARKQMLTSKVQDAFSLSQAYSSYEEMANFYISLCNY